MAISVELERAVLDDSRVVVFLEVVSGPGNERASIDYRLVAVRNLIPVVV